jgi:hypothetical protein
MATPTPVHETNGEAQFDDEEPAAIPSSAVLAARLALQRLREEQAALDYERIQLVKARRRAT